MSNTQGISTTISKPQSTSETKSKTQTVQFKNCVRDEELFSDNVKHTDKKSEGEKKKTEASAWRDNVSDTDRTVQKQRQRQTALQSNVEHTEKETEKKVQHALGGINRLNVGYNVSGCINQAY